MQFTVPYLVGIVRFFQLLYYIRDLFVSPSSKVNLGNSLNSSIAVVDLNTVFYKIKRNVKPVLFLGYFVELNLITVHSVAHTSTIVR